MNPPETMSLLSFPIREAGGFRYVDTAYAAEGEPVVFLHGMLGDVSNWNSSITALHAEGFRAVAPILPVYSISLKEASLDGLVTYVRAFLAALDIHRCMLVGNSLGGHLALLIAIRFPELVSSLVLSGASGINEVDLGSSIMRRQDRDYLRERVELTFFDPAMCTERLLDSVVNIINTRSSVSRLIRLARSVQQGSVKGLLGRINAPTLLIWGKEDRITPLEVAELFKAGIQDSELKIIDQCGHAPMMERPGVFHAYLLQFLEAVSETDLRAVAFR